MQKKKVVLFFSKTPFEKFVADLRRYMPNDDIHVVSTVREAEAVLSAVNVTSVMFEVEFDDSNPSLEEFYAEIHKTYRGKFIVYVAQAEPHIKRFVQKHHLTILNKLSTIFGVWEVLS